MDRLSDCFLVALAAVATLAGAAGALELRPAVPGSIAGGLIPDPSRPGVLWSVDGGPRVSLDGGLTWTPRRQGVRRPVEHLVVHPADPDRLWAIGRTPTATVLSSRDGGASWLDVSPTFLTRVNDVALGAGNVVYVAGLTPAGQGLLRSEDDGRMWRRTSLPAVASQVVVVPGGGQDGHDAVLVVTQDQQLYRSVDSGASLVRVDGFQGSLAQSSANPSSLYLHDGPLAVEPPEPSMLWRTVDGGATWSSVTLTPDLGRLLVLAVDSQDPNRLAAVIEGDPSGIAESRDGGQTWSSVETPVGQQGAIRVDSVDGVLFVSSFDETWRRDPAGTWRLVTAEDAGEVGPLAIDPSDPERHIWTFRRRQPLRSDDGGRTWIAPPFDPVLDLALAPGEEPSIRQIAIDSGGSVWLLAEIEGLDQRLFVSTDRGVTWSRRGRDLGRLTARFLTPGAAAGSLRVVLAPSVPLAPGQSPPWTPGVWRTDDLGLSWHLELGVDETGRPIQHLTAAPGDPEYLLLGAPNRGLFAKPGVNEPWARRPLGPGPSSDHRELSIGSDHRIYSRAFDNELWVSTDAGATWRSRRLPAEIRTLVASPRVDGLAIASTTVGLFLTRDGGASWNLLGDRVAVPGGIPRFDLEAPARVWLATRTRGLLVGDLGGPEPLLLGDSRFGIEVAWLDFEGRRGTGSAAIRSSDTGTFWFFGPDNLELMVKILDGRTVNGHWWIFFGSLSNVEFTLTLTDRATGFRGIYTNPLGEFASFGDVEAVFDPLPILVDSEPAAAIVPTVLPAVSPRASPPADRLEWPTTRARGVASQVEPTAVALGPRFRASIRWRDFEGREGLGQPVGLTADTGAFWFFSLVNLEMMVKVLDGRAINGHWWVFFGSLSNVEFTLRVEDTATGAVREYVNPLGAFASVGDVEGFPESSFVLETGAPANGAATAHSSSGQ